MGRRYSPRDATMDFFTLTCWMLLSSLDAVAFTVNVPRMHQPGSQRAISAFMSNTENIPAIIESPVLKQVYPDLLSHIEVHGHPNIPLGSSEGRKCKTLRRLQTQSKLSPAEVELLEEMGFQFNSLEDVYHEVEFDELYERLLKYEQEYKTGFQVPKKFVPDPELGAWVTGIRRLGKTGVEDEHAKRLDSIGFAWKSNRKCGSAFMKQYRQIQEQLAESENGEEVLGSVEVQNWLAAQRETYKRGGLSETRVHYMTQIFGEAWTEE